MANASFLDYRMPTTLDTPMIETVLVEVPNPRHPFGLRAIVSGTILAEGVSGEGNIR
jgi:CO/xanthine dehydrogenase Mo-binding subunit